MDLFSLGSFFQKVEATDKQPKQVWRNGRLIYLPDSLKRKNAFVYLKDARTPVIYFDWGKLRDVEAKERKLAQNENRAVDVTKTVEGVVVHELWHLLKLVLDMREKDGYGYKYVFPELRERAGVRVWK